MAVVFPTGVKMTTETGLADRDMNTIADVRREMMTLSASERACLAHELLLSLDDPSDFELSGGQEAEVQRRVQMVREGKAVGRPYDEVFADIEAKYR